MTESLARCSPELEHIFDYVMDLHLPEGLIAASAVGGYLAEQRKGGRLTPEELSVARVAAQCVALALSGGELERARRDVVSEPAPVLRPATVRKSAPALVVAFVR